MPKLTYKWKLILPLLLILGGWFWFCLPSKIFNNPTSFVLEDKDGVLLSAAIASDGQWRFSPSENVPDKFIKCITTFEDKRFYKHPGIDFLAIGRAIKANYNSNKNVQGGSTITMQLLRLSRNKKERNIWNKIVESIWALRMELTYSKKEIMELYAANAPFGGNVIGLEAASWRYFGRSSEKLSWGEMAALAVLPNSPSLVHPGKNIVSLKNKRNKLLDKLLEKKIIDSSTCELSKLEPLPGKPIALPQLAPHLLQRFKNEEREIGLNNTKLKTTIDVEIQREVIATLNLRHNALKANSINNSCALILDVETGNTLAYVGNIYRPDIPEMESSVDVIKAPRSPGSALKPILYAAAMSEGFILPHSLLPDVPTQIGGYSPQNFDRGYDGAVPSSIALSRSLNIPAVKLLQQYKYPRFYDLLKQLGVKTLNKPADNYGLSLILGGSEVTMWDLAGIYASMARTLNHQTENNGYALKRDFHPPLYYAKEKKKDKLINPDKINSLDAPSIWLTFQAMEEVMRPGEEGLWQQFKSSQRIAWKTGTSFGFRDAWAIGITSRYVVAVWVGNTNGEGRAGLVGVQAAAPIMFDIFKKLPSSKWFSPPENNFSFIPVCRESGFRANIDCINVDTVISSKNGMRSALCPYHKIIHLDKTGNFRVNENCESTSNMIHKSWFVLTPTMEWYYKQKNHDYKTLPPYKTGCLDENVSNPMDLIYPTQNAKIYVPLEFSGQRGNVVFTAVHRKPGTKIFWSLDNDFIGETINVHQKGLSPIPGKHVLTIVDENGESIKRNFEILESKKRP